MSPADPKIKQVVLTSTEEAPQAEGGAKGPKRTRKVKKGGAPLAVRFEKVGGQAGEPLPSPVTSAPVGGGATSPGTLVQLTASHVPGSSSAHAVGAVAPLTNSAAPVGRVAPAAVADPVAPVAKGGAAPSTQQPRVILAKSKKKSKVLLAAPKHGKTVDLSGANPAKKRSKTAKKVQVSLKGLTKKMSKAKKIHHKVSKNSLEDVKKELVAAGLIKADSKAPEDILRQMYTDFMVLKKRAL